MKAVKEDLGPTRVKLTVEVPFAELKPSVDAAYRTIGGQVRVQGFRPGKVPPRILDQRVGRGAVLEEAVNQALPRFYSQAATEAELEVLGRPEVDVTSFSDGEPLVFTAEVDVRPEVTVPDYDQMAVTVDAVDVDDAAIDAQLDALRRRFGTLEGVDRPAGAGDFVSIDLAATRDGTAVPEADTTGLSYEVGSGGLVDGLDEAVTGLVEGADATFTTDLVGEPAEVTVTVRGVKQQILPELDDDFATTASEFDTLAELRTDVRARLERTARLEQGVAARDKTLETLLEKVDVPVPAAAIDAEVEGRLHNLGHQLEEIGQTLESYLALQKRDRADFDAELRTGSERSVKATFVLDALAKAEELGVDDAELSAEVVRRAQRAGTDPQSYANQLVQGGQLPLLMGEIVRGKALALVLEHAVITDSAGAAVDLEALGAPQGGASAAIEVEDDSDADTDTVGDTPVRTDTDTPEQSDGAGEGGDGEPAGAGSPPEQA